MKKTKIVYNALIVIFLLLFLIPIWSVKYLPLQDWPVFMGFSYIISHFSHFQSHFAVKPIPPPYLTGFLLLAGLMRIFPPLIAGKILLSIYILSFFAAFYYYLKVLNPDALFLYFFAPLLVFNNFFAKGNINFILSLPIFLFVFPFTIKRLDNYKWSNLLIIFLLSLLLYFTHFFTYLVFIFIVFVIVIVKRKGIPLFVVASIPLFSFIGYFFINKSPVEIYFYHSFFQKFFSLRDLFGTWTPYWDVAIIFVPLIFLLTFAFAGWKKAEHEWKIVFFVLIFFYVISPTEVYTLMRPDQRFLVFVFLILLLIVGFVKRGKFQYFFSAGMIFLSLINVARKEKVFIRLESRIESSIEAILRVPQDKAVVNLGMLKYYVGVVNPFVNVLAYSIIQNDNPFIPSYDWNVPLLNEFNYPRAVIKNGVIKNIDSLLHYYDYFFVMEDGRNLENQLTMFTKLVYANGNIKLFKKK